MSHGPSSREQVRQLGHASTTLQRPWREMPKESQGAAVIPGVLILGRRAVCSCRGVGMVASSRGSRGSRGGSSWGLPGCILLQPFLTGFTRWILWFWRIMCVYNRWVEHGLCLQKILPFRGNFCDSVRMFNRGPVQISSYFMAHEQATRFLFFLLP